MCNPSIFLLVNTSIATNVFKFSYFNHKETQISAGISDINLRYVSFVFSNILVLLSEILFQNDPEYVL